MKYTYDVFISYNSLDRAIVQSLSERLKASGFLIWLDEWEIRVGDQIIQKISRGLEKSRYLAVWLSQHSIASGWVEREWQTKFGEEIDSGATVVLPLLGEKCKIPILLKDKKYADFTISFDHGFQRLIEALKDNASLVIHQCEVDLIDLMDFRDADALAKRLGDIAIMHGDEDAILALWKVISKAIHEPRKLSAIIDPCAYSIGRIVWETSDPVVEDIGFDIFNKSIDTGSELIVDKIAFIIGEVILRTKKDGTRHRADQFVDMCASSDDPLIREKFSYTKNRITRLLNG